MTRHNNNCPNITLPLCIAYIEALLPSLSLSVPKNVTDVPENDNSAPLLWAVQDKAEVSTLQMQLDNKNSDDITHCNLSTLPELAIHTKPERYQLACFWLPTLTEELLQPYIPLLMRYRDLYAAHLLVALDSAIDLRAYGFTPFDILNNEGSTRDDHTAEYLPPSSTPINSIRLWQFNLYDYKKLPNWLNSKYWANPENWGKERW
ncbi:DUF6231 family protein [Psychrobacter sp. CAL346-MNA-CIBAN-0220]|uniref:DUF6231 family protein n=1 Tax=Psychrobacter sp. CAL346-MNA-CIBAN-0220 TaxID=3140457 RepID=UPI00332DB556